MANINVPKKPETLELAYGPNIISLYDLDEDGNKYVVRILNVGDDVIATLRQTPNVVGYAHYDLQKVLQTQVDSNPNMETTTRLLCSPNEIFQYNIEVGYYNNTDGTVVSELPDDFYVLNGRKAFDDIDWDKSLYAPTVTENLQFNVAEVSSRQIALTDRHIKSTTGAAITDGKPTGSTGVLDDDVVWLMDRHRDDDFTLTFLNDWIDNAAPSFFNGIGFVQITLYNGNTLISTINIDNITSNGGGPNVAVTDGIDPTGVYKTLTIQSGISNPDISGEPTCTHYYIRLQGFASGAGTGQVRLSDWYRVDITNGDCNDFDNVEVSWVNSFGFRDYFDFQKRRDYTTTTTQNTYTRVNADYSATTFSIDSTSRGEKVFNNYVQESYTIRTRYLSDEESTYLKNMYWSPDVRVKLDGEWKPVIVTSNNYTERTFRKDRLFQHELTFKLANPQQIQHG